MSGPPGISSAAGGASLADAPWVSPFSRDRFEPVDPLVIEWARALCTDFGAKPDELIGEPQYPRWRAWVGYAENASRAALAMGFSRSVDAKADTSEPQVSPGRAK